ncbi:restriction endonuclease [Streptomyces sp. NPDC102406]|uniref:restriction endonuclease n=1 Tax=Streptomyces sp. NPDC102406 TaxID=3366171 RepID=UPI0037F4A5AC
MATPARRAPAQITLADTRRTVIPGILTFFGVLMVLTGNVGPVAVIFLIAGVPGLLWARRQMHQSRDAREIRELQSTEITRYHVMTSRQFEEAVAYLCQRDGCRDARVVGGAGDLGADVIATAPDGRRIVIQCKRYGPTTKVGSPDLQRFGGTCFTVHGAHVAAVVTTNVFTAPAANYAVQHGIRLFNEQALAAWATRTGPAPWM